MRKIIVNERQTGLMFNNGRFVKVMDAGKYILMGGKTAEIFDIREEITPSAIDIDSLAVRPQADLFFDVVKVGQGRLALRYLNGIFEGVLTPGTHAFSKKAGTNEFKVFDVTTRVASDFPTELFDKIDPDLYRRYSVQENKKGVLYIDGKIDGVIDSGDYFFWNTDKDVVIDTVDMRLTPMTILGQEVMTVDKVPVRVTFVLNYKIIDAIGLVSSVENYEDQMYRIAQLALREIVGRRKLDELIEDKDGITGFVFDKMKEKCREFCIDVVDAGVKDIILPGSIRDIMNTVLVAQKKAEANVITRREEVASTRSLLNTAKLMEENPTLYKLKELEYVERICENVGNINIGSSGDLLTAVSSIIGKKS